MTYRDGVYVGISKGIKRGLHLIGTYQDGKLVALELGENNEDEPYVLDAAEVLPKLIENQGFEGVDVVSGATYSSRGIFMALNDIMLQAQGKKGPEPEPQPWKVLPYNLEGNPAVDWLYILNDPAVGEDDSVSAVCVVGEDYYIIGSSEDADHILHPLIAKIDKGGNLLWKKEMEGCDFYNIVAVKDGLVASGTLISDKNSFGANYHGDSDFFAAKFDFEGNPMWNVAYGGSGYDFATYYKAPLELEDGSILVAGGYNSADGDFEGMPSKAGDGLLMKISPEGKIGEIKTFSGSFEDTVCGLSKTADGGYLLSGYTCSIDGDFEGIGKHAENMDGFVMKLDKDLNKVWGSGMCTGGDDYGVTAFENSDGSIILCGDTSGKDEDLKDCGSTIEYFVFTAVYDADGKLIKAKTYENKEIAAHETWMSSFERGHGNTYLISSGMTIETQAESEAETAATSSALGEEEDHWHQGNLICIDENGEIVFERTFSGTQEDGIGKAFPAPDGGFIVTAYSPSYKGDYDGLLIKYAPCAK